MEEIRIYCENTQSYVKVEMGYTLKDLSDQLIPSDGLPVLAALVDNKLKSLDYKIINPHNIRFIGYDHPDGRRTVPLRPGCGPDLEKDPLHPRPGGRPRLGGILQP